MPVKPFVAAGALGAAASIVAAGVVASHFAYLFAPFRLTREPSRLAAVLGIASGNRVADIGAGDGSLAVAMAALVGERGEVLATEIDPERRRQIRERAERMKAANITIIDAARESTNLADACCDAIYLRMMLHHVADRPAFARDVVRSVKPGGRLAVIDFPPGGLWFHGRDHGVSPEDVAAAFLAAGCAQVERVDRWGGPTFLLAFECGN